MPTRLDGVLQRLKSLHPRVIDLSLDRIERLLEKLGNPHHRLAPAVHVAGTNGKGSTIAFLRSTLEAHDYRVHVYTSPHLVRFNERIVINGHDVDDDILIDALLECERINAGQPITFFEITTAAAFLIFSQVPTDFVLLETGLGGRLDATNVLTHPTLSLITPISLDHQSFLGNSIREIAFEKAGIIKTGVPCLSTQQQPEAEIVLEERSKGLGAPIFCEGIDWSVHDDAGEIIYCEKGVSLHLPRPSLLGRHQLTNLGLALAAFRRLVRGESDLVRLSDAVTNTHWPARLQKLQAGPLADCLPESWELWLDGGHNPAAGEVLAAFADMWRDRPLDLVVGMLTTKDVKAFLAPLAKQARLMVAVAIDGEANALPPADLAAVGKEVGLNTYSEKSVGEALQFLAGIRSSTPARVLICGSLYLAGKVLFENCSPAETFRNGESH